MAIIDAYTAFDMSNLDLRGVIGGLPETAFFDDEYLLVSGVSYIDMVRYENSISGRLVDIAGSVLLYSDGLGLYSGTVTGLFVADTFGGTSYTLFIQDISLSARDVVAAMRSFYSDDDHDLLAAELWGSDTFYLSEFSDCAEGFSGNDTIYGYAGNDQLYGGTGSDILRGGANDDTLDGGADTDWLEGGIGNDTYILATSGDTVAESLSEGVDQVNAGFTYTLRPNVENLLLTGISAISGTGNSLANCLTGNVAANVLKGAAGNDVLSGSSGDDVLVGGAGRDTLLGGAGADDFVLLATSDSAPSSVTCDVVSGGFMRGYDDITVSSIDARPGLTGNQAFALDSNGSFSAGEIRQRVMSSGLLVEFNTDSDATVEMAILIQGLTSRLASTDFVL